MLLCDFCLKGYIEDDDCQKCITHELEKLETIISKQKQEIQQLKNETENLKELLGSYKHPQDYNEEKT